MQRRPFGRTGFEVPVLGFGAMQAGDPRLSEEHAARLLNHALDLGFTLVDTARSYGLSEERIGRHLSRRRDEFVLSTKVGYGVPGLPDWTYKCVIAGVDAAPALTEAHACGLGTIAKRPLAGQPWRHAAPPDEAVHAEYWRRFALLRPEFDCIIGDGHWEALALRFAAYAPGVDCVIVGGTNVHHLERNKAAIVAGPLELAQRDAIRAAFARVGTAWQGQI